jgi:hypothetical protein
MALLKEIEELSVLDSAYSLTVSKSDVGLGEQSDAVDRYRSPLDLSRFSLGDGSALVYSPESRAYETVPNFSVRMLDACKTFAPLEEHAVHICQAFGLGLVELPNVRNQLRGLAEAGLLTSHGSLLQSCMRNATPEDDSKSTISSLGIPTRNRPDSLRRCLESYAQCAHDFDRTITFVVVDESNQEETRQTNMQTLAEVKRQFGAECYYIGPREKQELAELIAQEGNLPAEVVNFALLNVENCPVSTGTSRNALLLSTIGDLTVQVDDDTQCRLAPGRVLEDGVTLTSVSDATRFWTFAQGDDESLCDRVERKDFFAVHEQLLGKLVGNCLKSHSGKDVKMDAAKSSFFRKLDQPNARVLSTFLGTYGDSGLGHFFNFMVLEGESRKWLLSSESNYRYAICTRKAMRAVTNPTITEGTLCMAMNLGLDNRELLPPFTPVQRNQDGVFGKLMRARSGFYGYLPWMIQHRASEDRYCSHDDLWKQEGPVSLGTIFAALADSFLPADITDGAEQTLRTLGNSFTRWGTMPMADTDEIIRLALWKSTMGHVQSVEAFLQVYKDSPDFWKKDMKTHLSSTRQMLAKKDFIVPIDLRETFGIDTALPLSKRLIQRFGEVLQIWPDIYEAASRLRDGGWRPGIKI